jgi:hypothetical protein
MQKMRNKQRTLVIQSCSSQNGDLAALLVSPDYSGLLWDYIFF